MRHEFIQEHHRPRPQYHDQFGRWLWGQHWRWRMWQVSFSTSAKFYQGLSPRLAALGIFCPGFPFFGGGSFDEKKPQIRRFAAVNKCGGDCASIYVWAEGRAAALAHRDVGQRVGGLQLLEQVLDVVVLLTDATIFVTK